MIDLERLEEALERFENAALGGIGDALETECPIEGCGFTYQHYHRDTLDGEQVVRVAEGESALNVRGVAPSLVDQGPNTPGIGEEI